MEELYDLAIIGTGPAGISAALTAKARGLNFIWFGEKALSKKVEKAERIFNYPGLCAVTGKEMRESFLKQIDAEGLRITEKTIHQIFPMGKHYAVFSGQDSWTARTLLLATGTAAAAAVPGETEFLGRGVSCCATCDGRLYQGKTIAVICTNPRYEEEIEFLAGLAKEVFVFAAYPDFGVEKDNVVRIDGMPEEIVGEELVSGIRAKGEAALFPVDGVFSLRDAYSPATLLKGLAMEENHIRVDRSMKTSLPGCYAAGDCTGRPYQYTKAAGEGNVAVHSAAEYLRAEEKECRD